MSKEQIKMPTNSFVISIIELNKTDRFNKISKKKKIGKKSNCNTPLHLTKTGAP